MKIGDSVRMGGIKGTIVDHYFDAPCVPFDHCDSDIWIVDLGGVRCECSTREIQMGLVPHEWEVACGRDY